MLDTLLDALPDKVEDRKLRIVYCSTLITLLRLAHIGRFPRRGFGKDLQLIMVYGTVMLAYLEGRKPTIASVARYLQLPHETTRRYLKTARWLENTAVSLFISLTTLSGWMCAA
jgi:hypothetical protein